ncbi:hypothetical protein P3339_16180 [Microbulbifer sp. MLAF003]|uniref:hypothetical protein n=1 Tax=Microbulbifer sp. MLAF003 TaxID=3032582 RepID=UPI0024AE87BA|nr:hypothetical protein [Microbulbifer sp. MLAF003]WHI49980.1 hypothetical protein P3339_16180 [Microbulbifer sp. MLAF003]
MLTKKGSGVMGLWLRLSLWLFLCVSEVVIASQILPASQHASDIKLITSTEDGSVENLIIRPPNDSGISVNRFSTFSVSNKSLKILNLPEFSGSTSLPATLIVIQSNNLSLANNIELVGEPADVLFITDSSSSTVSCSGCSFANFQRISLAAGTLSKSLSDSTSNIGDIKLLGTININQLSAPGALSVDVMGRYMSLNGEINTHQNVSLTSGGDYISDTSGRLTTGGGAVNLYLGNYSLRYESREITNIPSQARPSSYTTLNGTIRSTSVTATMANTWYRIATNIDTSSNLIYSTSYQDTHVINEESILIQSFSSPLIINSKLASDNSVTLQSYDSLIINENAEINAHTLSVLAKNQIINDANILTTKTEIAANDVFNKGEIEGLSGVDISVVDNLLNSFGGIIRGNLVNLKSDKGLIRNGSRTPFLSEYNQYNNLLSWDINNISSAELGTFFALGLDANEAQGKQKADTLAANILSNKLTIKGKAFENINPYYVYKAPGDDWSTGVPLNAALANQVLVSAETQFFIKADNYVVNSSAVMRLNQPGAVYIDTNLLTNERYRSQVLIERESDKWEENFYYYSPPGLIHTVGDFNLKADTGFINNTAFFEVFGNATLDTPKLKELGIAISQVSYTTYTTVYHTCLQKGRNGVCTEPGEPKTVETTIVRVNQDEKESLFHVEGNFIGPKTTVNFSKHDPIAYYQNLAIADYKSREFYIPYGDKQQYNKNGIPFYSIYTSTAQDEIRITQTRCIVNQQDPVDDSCVSGVIKTESITDVVIAYMEKIKNAVLSFFDQEFDWWD